MQHRLLLAVRPRANRKRARSWSCGLTRFVERQPDTMWRDHAADSDAARRERHRSLLAVTLPPEPEPEPALQLDALLAASAPALRAEVALWRRQGEMLLQRAACVVPTNVILALPAAFTTVVDMLELQLAQATALLTFEANPEALRCVLMWAVRMLDTFARV